MDKARELLTEINLLLDEQITIQHGSPVHDKIKDFLKKPDKKSKKPQLTVEEENQLVENITSYNLIFPEKTRIPTSGKIARSSPRELRDAFNWFLLNHPQYSWEIILKATELYIDEYRQKEWQYMRTSQYFVRKQNIDKTWTSELGNYCQLALDEEGGQSGESVENFTPKIV